MGSNNGNGKSLEPLIREAACSIRGAKDAPKYKGYIPPLIFTKRLSGLIKAISTKRLGLEGAEADIIGKSNEYLIRKFAEDRLFFVNVSRIFEKGCPKSFIPDGDILEQLGYGT
jgi:type I restriction-modification system DNA methylase subunit